MKALGAQKIPITTMPQTAPYETSSNVTGKSGFMDLLVSPPQQALQAKYDAMQGSWEGVSASESAATSSLFKAESMPVNQKQMPSQK